VAVDEQIQVVLAVLKGELSLAEAARRHGVSSAMVGNWRDRFVDAGKAGMDRSLPGPDGGLSQTERRAPGVHLDRGAGATPSRAAATVRVPRRPQVLVAAA
jgi:transposase-like protein